MSARILVGDCRQTLATLDAESVQTCVTSPPYYGLRDYGHAGQIGLEATPDEYVAALVGVFREVRRVLRADGTLWLNLGDSYASSGVMQTGRNDQGGACSTSRLGPKQNGLPNNARIEGASVRLDYGTKPKDLLMIPAMVALALRADGWWLRSDIIWHKANPMPESVTDRPTSAHEHVFLLSKRAAYFYDAAAIAEEATGEAGGSSGPLTKAWLTQTGGKSNRGLGAARTTRNARNVWAIATQPYSGAHFATMPPELAEQCIKAGSRPGDTVLDPFAGAGTTLLVADRLNRHGIGCELNPAYADLASARVTDAAPLFAKVAAE